MPDQERPRIEFPCRYPVKVMGPNVDAFHREVLSIIRRHAPELREEDISYRSSRTGRYLAVNVTIQATGTRQLQNIFEDLKASGRVSMVL